MRTFAHKIPTTMAQGDQVKNGKAFEYAIANTYTKYLSQLGLNVELEENPALEVARKYFNGFTQEKQERFTTAAYHTIETMLKLEPGLSTQKSNNDTLKIYLNKDSNGESGDVRDIIFVRNKWEVGFSAKNNNDATKHSRLSHVLDFGKSWVDVPCSLTYWDAISPIFKYLDKLKKKGKKWEDIITETPTKVYKPLLKAFRDELLRINEENKEIPQKLIKYLIGQYPFYKIIKDDSHKMVIVKAFNIEGKLNQAVCNTKARYKTPKLILPTRIVEFEMKPDSCNTLNMILDNGWEISFRIHSADKKIVKTLKFDIKLLGNPPILFTQHLFQD